MKTFKEYILNEGGAAGHMAHPFDVPSIKTGRDLINFFNRAVQSIESNPPSVKIDGVNASFRLIDTEKGKEFALDRGSMKPLDLEGITLDKLTARFGEGHGMVNAGNKLLTIMNEALSDIEPELKKLGMYDNANRFFNTEFVEGQTNVMQYDTDFLAIHGINEFFQATPRRRASKEVEYSPKVLESLIDKLNKYAKQYNFVVYGSVPAKLTKKPNFEHVLSKNFNVINGTEKISKPLKEFLLDANNPFGEKIQLEDGKTIGALSKFVYLQVLNGVPIDTFVKNDEDHKKAIDGAVLYHATRLLGDELLTTLSSPMGDVKYHEGIVIRDPKIHSSPVKVTGEFIVSGMDSKFRQESEEVLPYYSNYILNPKTRGDFYGKGRFTPGIDALGESFDDIYNAVMLNEFEDVDNQQVVVIYPGRFHPFHKGHTSVYNKLTQKFPNAHVYITTSGKLDAEKSPFTFEEKKAMMTAAGVDPNCVVEVKSPYIANEITQKYDSDNTKIIYAVSQKDMEGDNPRFKFGLKKDGKPSYFQPFISVGESEFMSKHGYVDVLPTMDFDLSGMNIRSASEVRAMYKKADSEQREKLIRALYGSADKEIREIFDSKLG